MTVQFYLAVDPGLLTGLAIFSWDREGEPGLLWSAEVTMGEYAGYVRWFLANYPDGVCVCEKFTITGATAKKTQAPYSLELIGVYKQCLRDIQRDPETDLHIQTPTDAKRVFPNPTLQKLGYWHKGGKGHANDAIRHGLLRLAQEGWAFSGVLKNS